jgi:hypothetical protein
MFHQVSSSKSILFITKNAKNKVALYYSDLRLTDGSIRDTVELQDRFSSFNRNSSTAHFIFMVFEFRPPIIFNDSFQKPEGEEMLTTRRGMGPTTGWQPTNSSRLIESHEAFLHALPFPTPISCLPFHNSQSSLYTPLQSLYFTQKQIYSSRPLELICFREIPTVYTRLGLFLF